VYNLNRQQGKQQRDQEPKMQAAIITRYESLADALSGVRAHILSVADQSNGIQRAAYRALAWHVLSLKTAVSDAVENETLPALGAEHEEAVIAAHELLSNELSAWSSEPLAAITEIARRMGLIRTGSQL
jgi:hypothetical protein